MADTLRAADMVTVQVLLVPVHDPVQPVKLDPLDARAVSVTVVPELNCAEQVLPQLIPDGLEVTVPVPLPDLDTLSVKPLPPPTPKVAAIVVPAVPIDVMLAPVDAPA